LGKIELGNSRGLEVGIKVQRKAATPQSTTYRQKAFGPTANGRRLVDLKETGADIKIVGDESETLQKARGSAAKVSSRRPWEKVEKAGLPSKQCIQSHNNQFPNKEGNNDFWHFISQIAKRPKSN